MRRLLLVSALALAAGSAAAQNSQPQPVPIVDTVPGPRDIAYPGVMRLEVDATDTIRAIFRVRQTIPVAGAGPMTLLYPKWLPGNHAPRGAIEKLAGLTFRAGDRVLPWRRDPVDMHAFHIDVPAGVREIEARFQFLGATDGDQGRLNVAQNMLNLQWEGVSLYPAGYFTRQIPVEAVVTYPAGWTAASGLPARRQGAAYRYERTSYETLVDSPVFAGRYYREWALSDRVDLNVFADDPRELEASADQIAAHRRLVEQATRLFGAQHYDRYEFLLAISDEMGSIGLEHHRSSENGVAPGYFTRWAAGPGSRNLLPHEFVHSWCGKFRRGADAWTPDFRTPMRNSLLWVYEGQTQFWGYVLQARAGLVSADDTRDQLAMIAAALDALPGRQWRPLADTTNDPIIAARRPKGWASWQRGEEYYNEGLLIWLEVDAILRAQSGGTRSMDDFARAFFGMRDGDWGVLTYSFDDVVSTLNAIQPYDWRALLTARLNGTGERAPLAGLAGGGYRLVFTDTPTGAFRNNEERRKITDLSHSIGLVMGASGSVSSVLWEGPAFRAGLTAGDTIAAINGQTYSDARLKDAITAAQRTRAPIRLVLRARERVREASIDYAGGLRYPRLEKTTPGEAGLDRLLTAR